MVVEAMNNSDRVAQESVNPSVRAAYSARGVTVLPCPLRGRRDPYQITPQHGIF